MGGKAGKSQVREVCSRWSDCVCLAGIFAHFLLAGFLALPSAISDISSQWHWYHTRPGTTAQNETSQPLPPPPCESGLASAPSELWSNLPPGKSGAASIAQSDPCTLFLSNFQTSPG